MAQKVHIELVDDIDGSEAAETVTFGLDGNNYEIDLSSKNAGKLRKALTAYVEGGRRLAGSGKPMKRTQVNNTKHIREWAKAQGMQVSDRGAIPADVREAYAQAHK